MKISYALIAACLSLQACNDQAPTASFDTSADFYVDEYNVGAGTPPAVKSTSYEEDYATYWIDTTSDDYTAAVSPAIKPIDGAEFEGTSRDDANTMWGVRPTAPTLDDYAIDWSIDTDDHTATVTSPASKPSEDKSVTTGTEFYLDDEGFALMLPAPIDLHAIQAKDWW